jgi:NADH:ubiquinone oxidoreductase subunit 3 (subunit A)
MGFKRFIGGGTFFTVLFFLAILGLGLFYIIKTRALEWE